MDGRRRCARPRSNWSAVTRIPPRPNSTPTPDRLYDDLLKVDMSCTMALNGKAAFGIGGLDDILCGGLTRERLYLLEGDPGTGKTTTALQFLLEGVKRAEPTLYITMSETTLELEEAAHSHGWSLDGIEVFELV